MHVAIDLFHSSNWTIDADDKPAAHRRPEFTDLGFVGHLRDALLTGLGAETQVLDTELGPDSLTGVDLLILPEPNAEHARPLSAAEAGHLDSFVRAGGGLLVLGGGVAATETPDGAAASSVPRIENSFVYDVDPDHAHLLTHTYSVPAVRGHTAVEGVREVYVHRPRALDAGAGLVPLVQHGETALVGATAFGAGRVAVVGNGEMFSLPFLGRADNAKLLLNLVAWLGGRDPFRVSDVDVRNVHASVPLPSRRFDPNEDLETTPGTHVVDAARYRPILESLARHDLPDPYTDLDGFIAEAELIFHELPRELRQAVSRFRHRSNDYGVLMIRGLPLDPVIPPTPANPRSRPDKSTNVSELWLAAFASALGSPFSYQQEKAGQMFQNLVPTPENATKLSSESSSSLLDFHTETAFHPHLPDYVMLHCLRPDHERVAKTFSAGVRMILPELSIRDRAVLFEPVFRTGIDYSFGSPDGTKGNGPVVPVLYGDPFDPFLMFDLDLMVGLEPDAERALANLQAAANKVRRHVRLNAEDLLIVDNRRSVHGRSEFTARYDGADRWLQRVVVMHTLVPSVGDRREGSRTLETMFAV